ncbi:MAG: alpha/beta hydrolase [Beijerinckiaceae bacterium]
MFHPGATRAGVVLLNSFGLESLRYRSCLDDLAARLAARGVNVLLPDLYGAGDSIGSTLDPDVLDTWVNNASAAVRWMRTTAGCDSVSLAGLRLGAIVAARAGMQSAGLDSLFLLAPPASGATYVREMLHARELLGEHPQPPLPFDGVSIAGFRLGGRALAQLETFEWRDTASVAAKDIRILAENRSGDRQAIEAAFAPSQAKVRVEAFPAFERALADTRAERRASPVWDAVADIMTPRRANEGGTRAPISVEFLPLSGPGFIETALMLDSGDTFAGIICQGNDSGRGRQAVVFLPGAASCTALWPRLPVELSRRLARKGITSVRLREPAAVSYGAAAGETSNTFARVLDWLASHGYGEVLLAGVASGSDGDFALAATDPRINRVFLLDEPEILKALAEETGRAEDNAAPAAADGAALHEAMRASRRTLAALRNLVDHSANGEQRRPALKDLLGVLQAKQKPVLIVSPGAGSRSRQLQIFVEWREVRPEAMPLVEVLTLPDTLCALSSDPARSTFGDALLAFAMDGELRPAAAGQRLASSG